MDNSHSYTNLTPVTFLERSGRYFAERPAVVLPTKTVCFGELLQRARRMASMLRSLGVGYGDRIGLLAHNSLQSIEAHYAIPGAGGVIVSFNPWLPAQDIVKQVEYSGARTILVSSSLFKSHRELFSIVSKDRAIVILDAETDISEVSIGSLCFDAVQHKYDANTPLDKYVRSENDAIAINFTSGTTGEPKGVVYSHRAAYLHALGQALMLKLSSSSIYYCSLPMFHVNGWGHIWATASVGAKQIVDDNVASIDSRTLVQRVVSTGSTHLAGAPRLIRYLTDEIEGLSVLLEGLTVLTGGAAPMPDLVRSMRRLGINLIHQYGLNETLGPFVVCEQLGEWDELSPDEQVKNRLRQGIAAIHAGTGLRVVDENMKDVPWDGLSQGEVLMSGNTVAQEYFNNPIASAKSFKDGWFHSGDVAVVYPDGYLEIKDRLKDLIFVETEYGWENISSIEIEKIISQFSGIKDIAVLGVKGEKEDTTIVAFYEENFDGAVDGRALIDFCKKTLPYFKIPSHFFEAQLPKTATGKIKKNVLENEARDRLVLLVEMIDADSA